MSSLVAQLVTVALAFATASASAMNPRTVDLDDDDTSLRRSRLRALSPQALRERVDQPRVVWSQNRDAKGCLPFSNLP